MTAVIYPGSFDPVTLGHLDIVRRGARLFDRLIVAVGAHHTKQAMFSAAERIAMLEEAVEPVRGETDTEISVVTFSGLLVEAARSVGAHAVLRGLRNGADFDYEDQMAGMNAALAPNLDLVLLPASTAVRPIAASLVRQIASLGGAVDAFVPPHVASALRRKLGR